MILWVLFVLLVSHHFVFQYWGIVLVYSDDFALLVYPVCLVIYVHKLSCSMLWLALVFYLYLLRILPYIFQFLLFGVFYCISQYVQCLLRVFLHFHYFCIFINILEFVQYSQYSQFIQILLYFCIVFFKKTQRITNIVLCIFSIGIVILVLCVFVNCIWYAIYIFIAFKFAIILGILIH